MELHLSLVTPLVLIIQALNGVCLDDFDYSGYSIEYDNGTLIVSQSSNDDSNTFEMNTSAIEPSSSANEDTTISAALNDTAGNPAQTDISPFTTDVLEETAISSTKPSDTPLPAESSATALSSLDPSNNVSCATNSTECDTPVTVTPESNRNASFTTEDIPGLTQPNSTSTTITVAVSSSTTNATVTSSTTITVLNTTVKADASGSDKGFAPFGEKAWNNTTAWGAIIGTALAVGFVGFVIYILLKRKSGQFMHRKLIEDIPSDPVLRLDNSGPLDLKLDGSAYYNPGLQGDHIQMTSFPGGRRH